MRRGRDRQPADSARGAVGTASPAAGALLDLCRALVDAGLALLAAAVLSAGPSAGYGGRGGFSAKGER